MPDNRDFSVSNHGSIFILTPLSADAKEWVSQYIPEDATKWGPSGIVVEHRFIGDILAGISEDGLSV